MRFCYHDVETENSNNTTIMKTQDLRTEINRLIQDIPDIFLEDIVSYLRLIEKTSEQDLTVLFDLKRIFAEDQELLEKLAK